MRAGHSTLRQLDLLARHIESEGKSAVHRHGVSYRFIEHFYSSDAFQTSSMLAQHANTLCDVVVRCLHTPRSATVPGELSPDAGRRQLAGGHGLLIGENSWLSICCFHLTLIFLTLIFVGFCPSKIQMALSLKTRNFYFGGPTTGRTPSSLLQER